MALPRSWADNKMNSFEHLTRYSPPQVTLEL